MWWYSTLIVSMLSSPAQAAFSSASEDGWWDEFTNNFATDLAPIISLFGEQVTKQFLGEMVSFMDYLIFAVAPLGIITAIVSVIRICGDSFLKSLIGRSREPYGAAEIELCSSTSEDVCELWSNGGICRVIGRPKILEFMFCEPENAAEYYPKFTRLHGETIFAPPTCGIRTPKEVLDSLKVQGQSDMWKAYLSQPEMGPFSGWEETHMQNTFWWPWRMRLLTKLRAIRSRLGQDEQSRTAGLFSRFIWSVLAFTQKYEGWPYNDSSNSAAQQPIGDAEQGPSQQNQPAVPTIQSHDAHESTATNAIHISTNEMTSTEDVGDNPTFAPYPNLALNIGMRKSSLTVSYITAAAMFGLLLQISVWAYGTWATFYEPKFYSEGEGGDKKVFFILFIIGTCFIFFGMSFSALLIDEYSKKRKFILLRRKAGHQGDISMDANGSATDHLFWLQPDGQRVGDQLFNAFAYSEAKNEYITSWRTDKANLRWDEGRDGPSILVYVAIALSFFGWAGQFIGLRGLHGSVALYQLACTIIMSIVRAFVRSNRFESNMNIVKDYKRRISGNELDWQALELAKLPATSKDDQVKWSVTSIPWVAYDDQKGMKHENYKYSFFFNEFSTTIAIKNDERDCPAPQKAFHLARMIETQETQCNGLSKEILEFLLEDVKGEGLNDQALPGAGVRLLHYRTRLASITGEPFLPAERAWGSDVRDMAMKLGTVLERIVDVLHSEYSVFSSDTGAVLWDVQCAVLKSSTDAREDKSRFCMLLYRDNGEWRSDRPQLEAILGLWSWTVKQQLHSLDRTSKLSRRAVDHFFRFKRVVYRRNHHDGLINEIFPRHSRIPLETIQLGSIQAHHPSFLSIPTSSSLLHEELQRGFHNQHPPSTGIWDMASMSSRDSLLQLMAQDVVSMFMHSLCLFCEGKVLVDPVPIAKFLESQGIAGESEAHITIAAPMLRSC